MQTEIYSIKERDFVIRPDTTDKQVVDEIWRGGIYNFLEPQPGDFIFDFGGHIGIAASWFAHHGAKVYSFEPIPDNYNLFVQNTDGLEQVYANNFPAMYKHDWYKLAKHPKRDNHHASYSVLHAQYNDDVIYAPSIALDVVFSSPLALLHDGPKKIKLDTEGAEYDHLLAGPTPWLDDIDRMFIEFHVYHESMMSYYNAAIKTLESHFPNVKTPPRDKLYRLLDVHCWR